MQISDAESLARVGLTFEVRGAVATLTLDRPDVRNAQTPDMWRAMAACGRQISDEVTVVLATGTGGSFSAGLDRRMLDPAYTEGESVLGLLALSDEQIIDTIGEYQEGFTFLRDPRFVSIAKVRGHAIGAGFQLALACDLRVVAHDVKFSMKEVALGLVPDLTGTKPLVDAVGYSRALEICATARTVYADEAVATGIALEAVEEHALDARVADLVLSLTGQVPGAVRDIKAMLLGSASRSLDEQRLVERTAQVRRFREIAALTRQG